MDIDYAHRNHFKLIPLSQPRTLQVFDGTESSSGQITHLARAHLRIDNHVETLFFFITQLAQFDIVLGLPWLTQHDPEIRWSRYLIRFNSPYCQGSCNQAPAEAKAIDKIPNSARPLTLKDPDTPLEIRSCSLSAIRRQSRQKGTVIFAITLSDIEKALKPLPNRND